MNVKLSPREVRTIQQAFASAIMNEEELIRCHYINGKCIDRDLVTRTQRFITWMKRIGKKLNEEGMK